MIASRSALATRVVKAAPASRMVPSARPVCLPIAQRSVVVRAEADGFDSEQFTKDLQTKWEGIENKPLFVAYSVGGFVAVWVTATVIGTVDKVPLFPKFFEAIGLAYSSWFTYRYLLFKTGREELIKDVEALKEKITASE